MVKIERHKAAIPRTELSKPVRLAFEAGCFLNGTTFFDYGCGYGVDVKKISEFGYESSGWDPFYFPQEPLKQADIVNLGYVINVIEFEPERRQVLEQAWQLTTRLLIIAAQVLIGDSQKGTLAFSDGMVTRRNTFQKYFDQQELKNYVDSILNVDAVPVGLGILFVFREKTQAQAFRLARIKSRATLPKFKSPTPSFEDHRELLQPLIHFMCERGRLPFDGELLKTDSIIRQFSSIPKAFSIIRQATKDHDWDAITEKSKQELLVFLALSKFGQRPKLNELPVFLQNDIKSFFGTLRMAYEISDEFLFSIGQPGILAKACRESKVGKLIGDTLYVHISALTALSPKLRLYEGCVSRVFGRLDQVTLVKLKADIPKVSYLYYPEFDTDPHPSLKSSMQVDVHSLFVSYRNYSTSDNPPILHRKETFVTPEYPQFKKFARLTQQEENWGLLDDPKLIGHLKGWYHRLETIGAELRGHRLVRAKINT